MAGTSGFEPEHAGVKVLCLTGLATSQYIIYGGQSRIWTCKSFPTNGFQDRFLTSLDIRHIFGASHGTRTRTRKSELPPQDSVSTKFHQERIFYFEIGSRWTQTIVSLTVIEVVSPQCCLTTCFQCPCGTRTRLYEREKLMSWTIWTKEPYWSAWRESNPHGYLSNGFWGRSVYQFQHTPKVIMLFTLSMIHPMSVNVKSLLKIFNIEKDRLFHG